MVAAEAPVLTGEQISALAYALPPLTPKGLGPSVEGVAIAFGVIAVIVVSLRVYVRAGLSGASLGAWDVDDWLAVIGTLPYIPAVAFASLAARYGIGSHDADLPSPLYLVRASEYQLYWEVFYFISSTIIKCAICFTCIRLDRRRQVTWIMGTNIFVMVTVTILALIFVFANCRPMAANWNPALGSCQTLISLQTVSYIVSVIQMITDWTCAIMPFFIVMGLQMSMRKKASVCGILGLGVFASIATCIRMPFLRYYDTVTHPTEIAYHLGVISITSNLECALGIIACSLPPLRKLFVFYYGSSSDSKYKSGRDSENVLGSSGPGIKLGSVNNHHDRMYHASVKRGGETDDERDDSSDKGIVRKTDVSVQSSSIRQ